MGLDGPDAVRVLIAFCLFSLPAQAADIRLPIKARIINLATMPIEEAIRYCDEHGMGCPNIRDKQPIDEQGRPWVSLDGEMVAE